MKNPSKGTSNASISRIEVPPPGPDLLQYALRYAQASYRCMPLHSVRPNGTCTCGDAHIDDENSIGKHPRIKGGYDAASTDPNVIKDWYKKWPNMNLGAFAPAGVVVVDIDPRNGGDETWKGIRGGRLDTPIVDSGGGGWHIHIRAHATRGKLGKGIDLLKNRQLMVMPPSNHRLGKLYGWRKRHVFGEVDVTVAPDWLQSVMVAEKNRDDESADDNHVQHSLLDRLGTRADLARVLDALKTLPSNDRGDWIDVASAMRRAFRHDLELEQQAFEGWKLWSHEKCDDSNRIATDEQCDATWESVDMNPSVARPITIGTIFWRAKRAGWVPETEDVQADEKGNARWIVRQAGERFLCSPGNSRDVIYAYNGLCWEYDTGDVRTYDIQSGLEAYWMQRAMEAGSDELKKKLLGHAAACRKRPMLTATTWQFARQPELRFSRTDLDAEPALLGCSNGVLDLDAGILHPHEPHFMLTKLVDVTYDPSATCPTFDRFISESLDHDQELIAFLQRVLGYVLSGYTKEQSLFFLLGPGNTGKSTLVSILRELLGVYLYTLDAKALMAQHSGSAYGLANIHGTRVVIVNELPQGKQFNTALLKQLSGEDEIETRMIYKEPMRFVPTCKIIMVGNERPAVPAGEDAFWRRVVVIPFERVVPPEERDPYLIEKLRSELPGILAYMVRGYAEWRAHGLKDRPAAVRAAVDDYRAEADHVMRWHIAQCQPAAGTRTEYGELRRSYEMWCAREAIEPVVDSSFAWWLSSRGYKTGRYAGKRVRLGVRLRT